MIAIPHFISPQEYLEIEANSPNRHEYRQGLVLAMAGGSDNHDRIAFNLLKEIDNHLERQPGNSPCRFYSGNVKVNYQAQFYYYPDAFVTCDPRDRVDRYLKRHPKLIAEVLSSSTETFDKGEKFQDYAQIDSLEEYLLISQDFSQNLPPGFPLVECRRRTPQGTWKTFTYGAGERLTIASLGLSFPIDRLYRGLDL